MSIRKTLIEKRASLFDCDAKLADFVLANPLEVVGMTIAELAEAAEVTLASANRFAVMLGFLRFTDFRAELYAEMRAIVAPETKLEALKSDEPASEWIASAMNAARFCIDQAENGNQSVALAYLAERILTARKVHFLGFGSGHFLASYAAHLTKLYVEHVAVVAEAGGTEQAFRHIISVSKRDVLIVFTMPRYSRDTIFLAEEAQKRGAYIVAFTDSVTAPISVVASDILIAGGFHPVLSSSIAGQVAMIEALAGLLARKKPESLESFRELSSLVDRFVFPAEGRSRVPQAPPEPDDSTTSSENS